MSEVASIIGAGGREERLEGNDTVTQRRLNKRLLLKKGPKQQKHKKRTSEETIVFASLAQSVFLQLSPVFRTVELCLLAKPKQ